MSQLDDYLQLLNAMPEADRQAAIADALDATKNDIWVPNPGPQTEAYFSQADVLLYGGEPGGGKVVCIQTLIPTPSGWSTMGELQVGDPVFDEAGLPCRVTFKSKTQFHDTWKVVFSDGSEIVAGGP